MRSTMSGSRNAFAIAACSRATSAREAPAEVCRPIMVA